MKMKLSTILRTLVIAAPMALLSAQSAAMSGGQWWDKGDTPKVTTTSGVVEGGYAEGIAMFRGIPYAAAPIGDLRLASPKAATPWEGVRATQEYSDVCPGRNLAMYNFLLGGKNFKPNEDCLYLNVITPAADDQAVLTLFDSVSFKPRLLYQLG